MARKKTPEPAPTLAESRVWTVVDRAQLDQAREVLAALYTAADTHYHQTVTAHDRARIAENAMKRPLPEQASAAERATTRAAITEEEAREYMDATANTFMAIEKLARRIDAMAETKEIK